MCKTEELTDEQKRVWEGIIENLAEYFKTPEGEAFYESFSALMTRINKNIREREVGLTKNEEQAMIYIRRKQSYGHIPTVREVTKYLGYRSSRTGHKILCSLKAKGFI